MSLAVTGREVGLAALLIALLIFISLCFFDLDETDVTCTGVQFHTSLPMQGEKLLEFNPCTD